MYKEIEALKNVKEQQTTTPTISFAEVLEKGIKNPKRQGYLRQIKEMLNPRYQSKNIL